LKIFVIDTTNPKLISGFGSIAINPIVKVLVIPNESNGVMMVSFSSFQENTVILFFAERFYNFFLAFIQ
jgi:hypothetical protein